MEKIQILLSSGVSFILKDMFLPIAVSVITTLFTMYFNEKRNRMNALPMMVICKISSEKMLKMRARQLPQNMYILLKYPSDKEQEVQRRPAPQYTVLKKLEYENVCRYLRTTSFVVLGVENISGNEVTLSRLINDIGQGQDLDSDQVPLFANGNGGYCLVFSEQDMPYEISGYMGETPIAYPTKNCESGKIRAIVKGRKERILRVFCT